MGKTILDDDPEFGRGESAGLDPRRSVRCRFGAPAKTKETLVSRIDKFDRENWHILRVFDVSKFGVWPSLTRLPKSYGNMRMRRSHFAPIKDTRRAD